MKSNPDGSLEEKLQWMREAQALKRLNEQRERMAHARTKLPERKGIKSEQEYRTANGTLEYRAVAASVCKAQHERLRAIATSFLQAYGWMRACDVTEEERVLHDAAQEFLGCRKENTG